MATTLDKDVLRESSVKIDGREVHITLTADQKIHMKLKGMKSGDVEIGIEDLFKMLRGDSTTTTKKVEGITKADDDMMISLYDLRHSLNVSDMDMRSTLVYEGILAEMIRKRKEQRVKK